MPLPPSGWWLPAQSVIQSALLVGCPWCAETKESQKIKQELRFCFEGFTIRASTRDSFTMHNTWCAIIQSCTSRSLWSKIAKWSCLWVLRGLIFYFSSSLLGTASHSQNICIKGPLYTVSIKKVTDTAFPSFLPKQSFLGVLLSFQNPLPQSSSSRRVFSPYTSFAS